MVLTIVECSKISKQVEIYRLVIGKFGYDMAIQDRNTRMPGRLCYHRPCSCLCEVDPGWMVEGQATEGWNHDFLESQMDGCHANQGSLHFMLS